MCQVFVINFVAGTQHLALNTYMKTFTNPFKIKTLVGDIWIIISCVQASLLRCYFWYWWSSNVQGVVLTRFLLKFVTPLRRYDAEKEHCY